VELSGKPDILRIRDDHRSPDQDGNSGAASDTRLRRRREGRAEMPGTADAPPLAALDRLPAVVALGYGDSELALRFSIVVLIRVSVPAW